jgi:hypothetical protein
MICLNLNIWDPVLRIRSFNPDLGSWSLDLKPIFLEAPVTILLEFFFIFSKIKIIINFVKFMATEKGRVKKFPLLFFSCWIRNGRKAGSGIPDSQHCWDLRLI